MQWSTQGILYWTRRGTWPQSEYRTAILVAFATSQGVDNYHQVPIPGGVHDYRGLWGLDEFLLEPFVPDLYNPALAAEWTSRIWETYGWDWSPVYRAGTWQQYGAEADAVLTVGNYDPKRETDFRTLLTGTIYPGNQGNINRVRQKIADLRAQVGH